MEMLELSPEEVEVARYAIHGHLEYLERRNIRIRVLEDLLVKMNIYIDEPKEEEKK